MLSLLRRVRGSEASLISLGTPLVSTKQMILRPSSSLWTTRQNLLVMIRAELYVATVVGESALEEGMISVSEKTYPLIALLTSPPTERMKG